MTLHRVEHQIRRAPDGRFYVVRRVIHRRGGLVLLVPGSLAWSREEACTAVRASDMLQSHPQRFE